MDKKQIEKDYQKLKMLLLGDGDNLSALVSFAKAALSLQVHDEAKGLLSDYLEKNHGNIQVIKYLGKLYKQSREYQLALNHFLRLAQLNPSMDGVWIDVADCYYQLHNLKLAEQSLRQGLKIFPNHPEIFNRLAYLYKQQGRQELAAKLYRRLTRIPKFSANAHFQLATIMQELNRPQKSIEHYRQHLLLQPNHADAHYGLGIAYAFMQDFRKAITCYEKALECSSNHLQSKMEICSAKATICDWRSVKSDRNTFEQALKQLSVSGNISMIRAAFDINYFNLSPEVHLSTAKRCALQIEKQVAANGAGHFPAKVDKADQSKNRIKIGYFSPDFREHAVGRLLFDIFRYHDRNEFEVYAYSIIVPEVEDDVLRAIKSGCDYFVNCQGLSALAIGSKIIKDEIDILIDLAGYTTYCKPATMALKPAPIQMHYLGNPDTMGANFSPFFITDQTLVSEKYQQYYTEQLVYLKHGWVASALPIDLPDLNRKDFNLPDDAFVYCSFNFPKKLSPETFTVWMRILHEVPTSVLWIYAPLQLQQDNLRRAAAEADIDISRIIFAENAPYDQYLSRLKLADIFLDSFFYGAGSTAANALMMGLPLLTLPGETFVSRLGSSVNVAAGMQDWNCEDEKEYFDKAVYWARNTEILTALKAELPKRVKDSALCNVSGFVKDLEHSFKEIYKVQFNHQAHKKC